MKLTALEGRHALTRANAGADWVCGCIPECKVRRRGGYMPTNVSTNTVMNRILQELIEGHLSKIVRKGLGGNCAEQQQPREKTRGGGH